MRTLTNALGPRPSNFRKFKDTLVLKNFINFLHKSRGLYLENWGVRAPIPSLFKEMIDFETACIVYKDLHGLAPPYME